MTTRMTRRCPSLPPDHNGADVRRVVLSGHPVERGSGLPCPMTPRASDTSTGQPSVLSAIVGQVCALLRCDRASLFVVDDDGGIVSLVLVGDAPTIRLRPGEGIAGAVVQSGRSVRIDDAWLDARFHRATDEATGYRTRSLLAVPLLEGGRVRGVVEALNKDGGAFDDDDEDLLLGIGGEIALAVERARQVEELERQRATLDRRVQELDTLVDIDRAIAGADSVQAILDVVCARVMDVVKSDGASIALLDKRTSALLYRSAVGLGQDRLIGVAVATDTGLAGIALRERAPVRVADALKDVRHAAALSRTTGLVPGPLVCVPLLATVDGEEKTLGVLTAVRARGADDGVASVAPRFTVEDERLLVLLANRVASAVQESERRERAREKQQLEAMGHMLAGIVHDFKTPMTVISGYVQLMAAEDDAKEREAQAAAVLKSTEQMTAMIKELMAFARGDSTVLLRKVWIEGFADELSALLARMVREPGAPTLTFSCTATGQARIDPVKVQRAIVNLVKNAREALEPLERPGHITVAIADDGRDGRDDLVFVVEDDGPGLAPEIAQRVFETFASFGKAGGTGLGLALVKRIAEDHRGGVTVERPAAGGCRFTLRLPRV
jgi:signal transduction histidine kinase/putative methionine-R-sulfoxide reductase with GAF domain